MWQKNQRVGVKDRFCLLYRGNFKQEIQGIGFIGTYSPLFQIAPSCFTLVINGLYIVNYSSEFILSKNMGFPYPRSIKFNEFGNLVIDMSLGLSEISYPIIKGKIVKPAIRFYQSILSGKHYIKKSRLGKRNKFIKQNSMLYNQECIKSKIFVSDELNNYHDFWKTKNKMKFSPQKFPHDVIRLSTAICTLEYQNASANRKYLLEEYEASLNKFIEHNNKQINLLKDMLKFTLPDGFE